MALWGGVLRWCCEVAFWGDVLRWHCEVAFWGGVVRWHFEVMFWDGIVRWHWEVVLWGGVLRWHCEVALWGGVFRWHCEVAFWGGIVRWCCEVAMWGGVMRWHCEVVLWGGVLRWHCEAALWGGIVWWHSLRKVKLLCSWRRPVAWIFPLSQNKLHPLFSLLSLWMVKVHLTCLNLPPNYLINHLNKTVSPWRWKQEVHLEQSNKPLLDDMKTPDTAIISTNVIRTWYLYKFILVSFITFVFLKNITKCFHLSIQQVLFMLG